MLMSRSVQFQQNFESPNPKVSWLPSATCCKRPFYIPFFDIPFFTSFFDIPFFDILKIKFKITSANGMYLKPQLVAEDRLTDFYGAPSVIGNFFHDRHPHQLQRGTVVRN